MFFPCFIWVFIFLLSGFQQLRDSLSTVSKLTTLLTQHFELFYLKALVLGYHHMFSLHGYRVTVHVGWVQRVLTHCEWDVNLERSSREVIHWHDRYDRKNPTFRSTGMKILSLFLMKLGNFLLPDEVKERNIESFLSYLACQDVNLVSHCFVESNHLWLFFLSDRLELVWPWTTILRYCKTNLLRWYKTSLFFLNMKNI